MIGVPPSRPTSSVRGVDVIVTLGGAATQAAQQATRTIPIVMSLVNDPVGSGLVASLAHPGGNVTGLTAISPDLLTCSRSCG
jgi:putative ABC transport system substrate-binding protein